MEENAELWLDKIEYEGLYQVSTFGRVKSLKDNNGNFREKIKQLFPDKDGYLRVVLYKKRFKQKNFLVSRLVAETFIPNPENKLQVDHINKIKEDNRVENLQWLTCIENNRKSWKQGKVNSEKQKESVQVVSIWINEKLGLEFVGNSYDLVRAFPEQKLSSGCLRSVRREAKSCIQHKGWKVK